MLIEKFSPRLIVLFGIGGAYPSGGLRVGDIAVAEKEVYADTGVLMRDGLYGLDSIGIPLVKKGRKKYFNDFPLDKTLTRQVLRISGSLIADMKPGGFLTVSQSTGTRRTARIWRVPQWLRSAPFTVSLCLSLES
jgi:futalosine hydrolase